jgi:hypothetical protein
MEPFLFEKEKMYRYFDSNQKKVKDVLEPFLGAYDVMIKDITSAENEEVFLEKLHHHASVFTYVGLESVTKQFKRVESFCRKNLPYTAEFNWLLKMLDEAKLILHDELINIQD